MYQSSLLLLQQLSHLISLHSHIYSSRVAAPGAIGSDTSELVVDYGAQTFCDGVDEYFDGFDVRSAVLPYFGVGVSKF